MFMIENLSVDEALKIIELAIKKQELDVKWWKK
jgi:hypothetical protein